MTSERPWFLVTLYDKNPYTDWLRAVDETEAYRWLATGGTAEWCRDLGVDCTSVDELVGLSSRLGGKVKTLHPDLYTGIMAESADDLPESIPYIRGVLVDLTPFEIDGEYRPDKVDIGGPSLLRAGVKSCRHVVVLSDPESARLHREHLPADEDLRRRLARRTLRRTLRYDKELMAHLDPEVGASERAIRLSLVGEESLRYGENPGQSGRRVRDLFGDEAPGYRRLFGDGLSYTNCLDVEAARRLAGGGEDPEASVIKHTNPTGWATGESLPAVIRAAWEGDPKSAFGSVIGLNRTVNEDVLDAVEEYFVEALVAPSFDEDALDRMRETDGGRPRAIQWEGPWDWLPDESLRSYGDGYLVQSQLRVGEPADDWTVVSKREPDPGTRQALEQMWTLCRWVTSNAAVVGTRDALLGAGAGQQSRVDAVRLALEKAETFHDPLPEPLVVASDGFFPFPDNVEIAADHGVDALVAPGGSVRDEEVIEAANEREVALIFTDSRIFYH